MTVCVHYISTMCNVHSKALEFITITTPSNYGIIMDASHAHISCIFPAGSGIDYVKVAATLGPFTGQQPRQCFRVNVIDDGLVEPYEYFSVALALIQASVTTITANRITVNPHVARVWII